MQSITQIVAPQPEHAATTCASCSRTFHVTDLLDGSLCSNCAQSFDNQPITDIQKEIEDVLRSLDGEGLRQCGLDEYYPPELHNVDLNNPEKDFKNEMLMRQNRLQELKSNLKRGLPLHDTDVGDKAASFAGSTDQKAQEDALYQQLLHEQKLQENIEPPQKKMKGDRMCCALCKKDAPVDHQKNDGVHCTRCYNKLHPKGIVHLSPVTARKTSGTRTPRRRKSSAASTSLNTPSGRQTSLAGAGYFSSDAASMSATARKQPRQMSSWNGSPSVGYSSPSRSILGLTPPSNHWNDATFKSQLASAFASPAQPAADVVQTSQTFLDFLNEKPVSGRDAPQQHRSPTPQQLSDQGLPPATDPLNSPGWDFPEFTSDTELTALPDFDFSMPVTFDDTTLHGEQSSDQKSHPSEITKYLQGDVIAGAEEQTESGDAGTGVGGENWDSLFGEE